MCLQMVLFAALASKSAHVPMEWILHTDLAYSCAGTTVRARKVQDKALPLLPDGHLRATVAERHVPPILHQLAPAFIDAANDPFHDNTGAKPHRS